MENRKGVLSTSLLVQLPPPSCLPAWLFSSWLRQCCLGGLGWGALGSNLLKNTCLSACLFSSWHRQDCLGGLAWGAFIGRHFVKEHLPTCLPARPCLQGCLSSGHDVRAHSRRCACWAACPGPRVATHAQHAEQGAPSYRCPVSAVSWEEFTKVGSHEPQHVLARVRLPTSCPSSCPSTARASPAPAD